MPGKIAATVEKPRQVSRTRPSLHLYRPQAYRYDAGIGMYIVNIIAMSSRESVIIGMLVWLPYVAMPLALLRGYKINDYILINAVWAALSTSVLTYVFSRCSITNTHRGDNRLAVSRREATVVVLLVMATNIFMPYLIFRSDKIMEYTLVHWGWTLTSVLIVVFVVRRCGNYNKSINPSPSAAAIRQNERNPNDGPDR